MVEVYGIRRRIGGTWFEDSVCCSSWEEAEEIAEKLGGEVTGRLVDTIVANEDEMEYGEMLALGMIQGTRTRTDW